MTPGILFSDIKPEIGYKNAHYKQLKSLCEQVITCRQRAQSGEDPTRDHNGGKQWRHASEMSSAPSCRQSCPQRIMRFLPTWGCACLMYDIGAMSGSISFTPRRLIITFVAHQSGEMFECAPRRQWRTLTRERGTSRRRWRCDRQHCTLARGHWCEHGLPWWHRFHSRPSLIYDPIKLGIIYIIDACRWKLPLLRNRRRLIPWEAGVARTYRDTTGTHEWTSGSSRKYRLQRPLDTAVSTFDNESQSQWRHFRKLYVG